MKKVTTTCKITEFKARCLEIIASVTQSGEAVEVTRRGSSMVRVVPAEVAEPQPAYGFLRGVCSMTARISRPYPLNQQAVFGSNRG